MVCFMHLVSNQFSTNHPSGAPPTSALHAAANSLKLGPPNSLTSLELHQCLFHLVIMEVPPTLLMDSLSLSGYHHTGHDYWLVMHVWSCSSIWLHTYGTAYKMSWVLQGPLIWSGSSMQYSQVTVGTLSLIPRLLSISWRGALEWD